MNPTLKINLQYKLIKLEDEMKECLKNIDEEILNIQNNYWEENIMNENPLKIENDTLSIFDYYFLRYQLCYYYKEFENPSPLSNMERETVLCWIVVLSNYIIFHHK